MQNGSEYGGKLYREKSENGSGSQQRVNLMN